LIPSVYPSLDGGSHIYNSHILKELIFNKESSSSNYYEQMNDWSYFVPKDEKNWVIPKTYNVNLEDECNDFVKNVLHEGQEGIEFKNM